MFDRDTDETIAWIQEKEAALLTEDYGQDLDAVEALQRTHEAFEVYICYIIYYYMSYIWLLSTSQCDLIMYLSEHKSLLL